MSDIAASWMPDASLACGVCGEYTNNGAVHVCDVETVGQQPSCLNICPACIGQLARFMPSGVLVHDRELSAEQIADLQRKWQEQKFLGPITVISPPRPPNPLLSPPARSPEGARPHAPDHEPH